MGGASGMHRRGGTSSRVKCLLGLLEGRTVMSVTNCQPTPYNIINSRGLYESYFSPNVIRIKESRIIRWVEHVECIGEERLRTRFWWGNMTDEGRSKDLCGRVILKWVIKQGRSQ